MAGKIVSELIYRLIADEKDLVAGLKAAEKRTEDLAKTFTETGKKLSLGLTAPIIAAGAAAVKLASDVGEAFNAANVVFRDSTSIIEDWGANAVEQAGLTRAEFFQASAVIGAGLINAGESADVAARQTIELTKRAADLASIFNTDVNDALTALQSGLRGESEPLRRFAVNLNEAAVAAKAVELGLADSEKEVSDYAKSQARLAVILEQTQRFQGDFVNTSDQLANSTRILKAQIKEQAAELGEQLLPIVLDVVTGLRDLVDRFSDLDDETRKNILIAGGVLAALGPVLIGIGNLITAVNTAKIAFAGLQVVLAANPLFIAGAAVAAGILAVTSAINGIKKAGDDIKESRSIDFSDSLENNRAKLEAFRIEVQAAFDRTKSVPENLKKSFRDQALELAKIYGQMEQQLANQEEQLFYENEQLKLSQKVTQEKEAAAAALAAQNALQEELNKKVEQKYLDARAEVLDILASEKTEYQLIQEQIDRLSSTPWATGKLENDRLAAIEVLRARQKAITDAEIAETQAAEDAKAQARADAEEESFRLTKARAEEFAKEQDEGIEEEKRKRIEATQAWLDFSKNAFSILQTIQQNYTNQLLAELDRELQATLEAEGVAEQTKLEKLNADLEATKAKLAAETDEAKRAELAKTQAQLENDIKREQITKEFEKKKADIVYKGQLAQWQLTKLQAVADSASAIIKAATSLPWPANLPAIGFASALGGLQLAAINGAKPVAPPAFAEGTRNFMVPPGFPNDSFPILVQSGERVTVETPQQQAGNGGDAPIFQIGTVIADPAGLRELDALLRKYGTVENLRRG